MLPVSGNHWDIGNRKSIKSTSWIISLVPEWNDWNKRLDKLITDRYLFIVVTFCWLRPYRID